MATEEQKPSSAVDFLKAMTTKECVKKLSNGVSITLRKIKVRDAMQKGVGGMPLPVVMNEADVSKLSESDRKKMKDIAEKSLRFVITEGVASPRIVDGDKSDPDNGVIALDDPDFDDSVKTEILAHVFDYNGYSERAKEFFRLLSPG